MAAVGNAMLLGIEKSGGNDVFTRLLLHCDGTNGSTTFTDSSQIGRTVTANGNAQVSTAQSKFGGASALFDGTGDYLSIADSADLELSGDFTIDWWFRTTTVTAITADLISKRNASSIAPFIAIQQDANLTFYASSDGTNFDIAAARTLSGTILANTWYHFAVVRSGTSFFTFQDGVQKDTWTSSATPHNNTFAWCIGGDGNNNALYANGYVDEVRFSYDIARWVAGFTPPSGPYA
jgi:hypothetical protein